MHAAQARNATHRTVLHRTAPQLPTTSFCSATANTQRKHAARKQPVRHTVRTCSSPPKAPGAVQTIASTVASSRRHGHDHVAEQAPRARPAQPGLSLALPACIHACMPRRACPPAQSCFRIFLLAAARAACSRYSSSYHYCVVFPAPPFLYHSDLFLTTTAVRLVAPKPSSPSHFL